LSDDEGESATGADQNGEEKRRLERLEREKWLKESGEMALDADDVDEDDSQFFAKAKKVLNKAREKKDFTKCKSPLQTRVSQYNFIRLFKLLIVNYYFQSVNQRGSFLTRAEDTLKRIAEMTKGSVEGKTGTGAKNTHNFVFAALSPGKKEAEKVARKRKMQRPKDDEGSFKKPRLPRAIDENSSDTIFGKM